MSQRRSADKGEYRDDNEEKGVDGHKSVPTQPHDVVVRIVIAELLHDAVGDGNGAMTALPVIHSRHGIVEEPHRPWSARRSLPAGPRRATS
jgi:hypothetical protein